VNCRHCARPLQHQFVDLGTAPPSNSYLVGAELAASERYYPLRVLVCDQCWLVQTEDYAGAAELFSDDYAYFSSYSDSWLEHSKTYVAEMRARLALGASSTVVEIGANDGYLLQYVKAHGIPCYGIEPTASTAAAARAKGIEIREAFFGRGLARELAAQGRSADLIVANNVLAHVPDINDFAAGVAALLKPAGVATFEFPHLLRLVREAQFDTIYHEHYSYLSLTAVGRIFTAAGLGVFDVQELPTHGGSLRVFAQREGATRKGEAAVAELLRREQAEGLASLAAFQGFQARADRIKDDLLRFLLDAKRDGRKVAAYGAAAKGNTLLNYAGVRDDLLAYVADRNPNKQGKYLPGSRIPVVSEEVLRADRPHFVVVLPWNLADEVTRQLSYIGAWGGRFVRAVPSLQIIEAKP
jgi:SAM-dependent methyltransferase